MATVPKNQTVKVSRGGSLGARARARAGRRKGRRAQGVVPSCPGHKASHPPALAPSHPCALLPLQSRHKASCPGQSGCMALHPHTQGHKASRPPTLVPSCPCTLVPSHPCSQGTRPHAQGSQGARPCTQGARPHTQGVKPHTQGARPRALTPMQFELVFHFPPPLSATVPKNQTVKVS